MRLRRLLMAIMIAIGMNSVAYAAEQYELTNYSTGTICNDFLKAVKSSGVASMNEKQLCEVRNSPTGVIFAGKKMTNLTWTPYEVTGKFQLAKTIFENSFPKSDLPRFQDSEKLYLKAIQTLISKNKLRVMSAPMQIDGQKVFVIMLQTSRCDGSEEDRWMPGFDFFRTQNIDDELVFSSGGQMGGQLVYLEGVPAALNVDPFWGPSESPHPVLVLPLMTLHQGKNVIFDGNMCQINITK